MIFQLALKNITNKFLSNDGFTKLKAIQTRQNKYYIPIKWKKPAEVLFCDPIRTGDLTMETPIDLNLPPILYEKSQEYQTADELVKRLFSFHFIGRGAAMRRYKDEMIDKVKNHKYDHDSPEVQIAAKTAIIRNMVQHYHLHPLDKRAKIYLSEAILKRKKRMKILRKWDYKRFEWVLDELDVTFRPHPVYEPIERKKSIRKLTAKYCEEYKSKKLEDYKQYLNNQKADFLKNKLESLQWIRKEELECGVEPTVTEEHITETKKKLDNILTVATDVKEEVSSEFRLTV